MAAREPARLILLGGLPGSGKSHCLAQLTAEGWEVFDDFQKKAINNDPAFPMSRNLAALLQSLRAGRRCVVADVRLVTQTYRDSAFKTLRQELLVEFPIDLRIFELDEAQCEENINNASEPRDIDGRLRILREFAPQHSLPSEATVLSVWRPNKQESAPECSRFDA